MRVPGPTAVASTPFRAYEYLNYGDSDYDARHRLSLSYNYEVPIFSSWQDNWACVKPSAAGTSPA